MASGCVEQFYNQGHDSRWGNSSITSNGVCMALAIYWLRHKAEFGLNSLNFWDWLGVKPNARHKILQDYKSQALAFLNRNNEVFAAMQAQITAVRQARDQRVNTRNFTTPLVKYLMEDNSSLEFVVETTRRKPNLNQVLREITREYYQDTGSVFHFINTQGEDWGHAIACAYECGGEIFMMDPNNGEVSWSNCTGDNGFMQADSMARTIWTKYYDLTAIRNIVFRCA